MAFIRAINWPATVSSVQSALDGTTYGALSQAELTTGASLRDALSAAGATYDAQSTDGILNTTAYALSVQAWSLTASPAWMELDRVCRAIFQLVPPANNYSKASFGTSGIPSWQPQTAYLQGDTVLGAVQPSPANGYAYLCAHSGTSGASSPGWSTTLGAITFDGTAQWQCVTKIGGQTNPVALPWDLTQQTVTTLNTRYGAALIIVATTAQTGFLTLLNLANASWVAALAAKPAAQPTADAVSLSANSALGVALANATQWLSAAAVR